MSPSACGASDRRFSYKLSLQHFFSWDSSEGTWNPGLNSK